MNQGFDPGKIIQLPKISTAITETLTKEMLTLAARTYANPDHPESLPLHKLLHLKHPDLKEREEKFGKLNPGQVKRALIDEWMGDEELFHEIVVIWTYEHSDLVDLCTEWINSNQKLVIGKLTRIAINREAETYITAAIQEFSVAAAKEKRLRQQQDSVFLAMLIALTLIHAQGEFQLADYVKEEKSMKANKTEHDAPQDDAWNEVLQIVSAIPAESDQWDSFDLFLDSAKQIAETKRKARAIIQRSSQLQMALEAHHPKLVDRAQYFQVEGVENWRVEHVTDTQYEEATRAIQKLADLLVKFDQLDELALPTNRSERLKLDDARHLAEDDVIEGYNTASQYFLSRPNADSQTIGFQTAIEVNEKHPEPQVNIQQVSSPEAPVDSPETAEVEMISGDQGQEVTQAVVQAAPEEVSQPLTITQTEIQNLDSETFSSDSAGMDDSVDLSQNGNQAGEISLEPDVQSQESTPTPDRDDSVEQISESVESGDDGETDFHSASEETIVGQPIEIAVSTDESISSDDVRQALLNRLIEKNLHAAYWLAYGLEQQEQIPEIPSWLIAAQQSIFWSNSLWPNQTIEFLNEVSDFVQPQLRSFENCGETAKWMQLSTGIYFGLLDPQGRWDTWLDGGHPTQSPAVVSDLLEIIDSARKKGVHLDSLLVQMAVNADEVEKHIVDQSSRANQWLKLSASHSARFGRAQQVWNEFVRPSKGELFNLIELVATDQRDSVEDVSEGLDKWRDRNWLDRHIQKVDKDFVGRNARPIVGEAREQLIGWIVDILIVADEWCSAVISQEEVNKKSKWEFNQVRQLCESLSVLFKDLRLQGNELLDSLVDNDLISGLELFNQTIQGLSVIVDPGDRNNRIDNHPISVYDTKNPIIDHLARPLFLYPEISFDNNGIPEPSHLDETISIIAKQSPHSHEEAVQLWMDLRDYRFIEKLLDTLPNRDIWEARIREAQHSDILRIEQKDIEETVVDIEQALLEGLIAETEHTEFTSRVESIKKQIRQIDLDGIRNISLRDYGKRLADIHDNLHQKREERLQSQHVHWGKLKPKLSQILGEEPEYFDKIQSVVETSIKGEDLRAAGEYLAHLDHSLSTGKLPEKSLFESKLEGGNQDVVEFQNLLPNYVSLLEPHSTISFSRIRDAYVKDEQLLQIPMQPLPKPRREEVSRALDAWQKLKRSGQMEPVENLTHVATLMRFLGFTLNNPSPVANNPAISGPPNFIHWKVMADASGFAPVAQFGSLRERHYEVLGIWDRPGIDVISAQVAAMMQQTGNTPSILFYFHYLTPSRRETLFTTAHRGRLPILVIDEALILHLAREHGSRLRPMFNITLPYAALVPYFPSSAGLVPPEVYKGRQDLLRSLIDPLGPAIVYGGRQLGKSALLRQVQREFHRPDNGQYVIYEDIKVIGDPASGKPYQNDFRDRIAHALLSLKLVEPQRSTMDLEKLLNHIGQQIREKKIRLLLLLDEADHFLDADAERNFNIITKLKNTMDQTGRQFKIVLAGLHNVQRFQRIANQPLAHLGSPIEIGPLEPEPARQLLVDPLNALGFSFGNAATAEDTALVLHILSYTNYHPGLIQLFGKFLVDHLLKKHQRVSRLPVIITRADVEAVYRNDEVRKAIRDRFKLTLALDPRYEAITLALILEQLDDQNGFDRSYSPKLLRELSATWWPQAFTEEISPDRFAGYLEEMRGLGVLSMSQDGNAYRLRSPNLVHLMGTRDEILDAMDFLSHSSPPEKSALESIHAKLETDEFSPITFAQERSLNSPKSGVALLFGSYALGVGNLSQALQRLIPEKDGAWTEIRVAARNSEAIQKQLKEFVRENSSAGRLIAYRELDGSGASIAEEILGAVQFCRQIRRQILRVCFTLDANAALQWFQLPAEIREGIEEKVDVVMSLKRWDKLGIKQRLEMDPQVDEGIPDRMLSAIMDSTGGWHYLVDEFATSSPLKDLDTVNRNFRDKYKEKNSAASRSFLSSLGISDDLSKKIIIALQDPAFVKDMRENAANMDEAIEWLTLSPSLEGVAIESITSVVEYLKVMGILSDIDRLELEPLVSRLWYES